MSTPRPGPSTTPSPRSPVNIDDSDIPSYESFMQALERFMNESSHCIQEVKERSGLSIGCSAPVIMNQEEKKQKMKEIAKKLFEQYTEESINKANESSEYHTAVDTTENETAHNTAFMDDTSTSFRPPVSSTPCPCPEEPSEMTSPSRYYSRSKRAGTPRPGTTPIRGRVATPDQYFVPLSHSSMNASGPCPAATQPGASRSGSKGGRQRTASPYSTLIDSGGVPYAFQSGTPPFRDISSEQGRGLSSYSNSSSRPAAQAWSGNLAEWSGSSACPPDCTGGSVNSTGRQQYRKPKGGQNAWDWKQDNRTI